MDRFQSIRDKIDFRISARAEYETRVASKNVVLDIGGQNQQSRSNRKLRQLSSNPGTRIIATDVFADYNPDIVDDICNSKLESNCYEAVYCDAILEHVVDYNAAIGHIHRILKPGGELFIYVPFFWRFHDRTDHHRFTITEVGRILSVFSDYRLFLPDSMGYGGVLWQLLTFHEIEKYPLAWKWLSQFTNALLSVHLASQIFLSRHKRRLGKFSFNEYKFYHTHLFVNHGFCGWASK